ncbi:MAG: ATP-binding protein [Chloroflexi bacterium]|nr:ATP-binding protein [Chloroflexota bacterium]
MTQQGRVNFSREDIGGEILPILTRGLYRDMLDSLREYIQNAIDAKATQIEVAIDPDVVSIFDDGSGMNSEEARKAIRLGISDKNPLTNVGFRGVGIYSGFNLCDTLEIFTKSSSSPHTYRLFFDFKTIRRELLAEQERRQQGKPPQLYLERLLEESVFVEPVDGELIEGHGTRVILSGLLPDAYLRINDWTQVSEYLENVVPLPFNPEFKFGERIQKRFQEADYRVVPLKLQIGSRSEALYRPYTDQLFRFLGKHPPEFFDVKDGPKSYGFAWVCVNDARETIKDSKIRGLLIKKFGFSISDRRYLEPFFGRTVYSRRITGEVIVTHPNLIPNAARSDFENNSTRQAFVATLPRLTRTIDTWANEIQEEDRAREVLADIAGELSRLNSDLPSVKRDREQLVKLSVQLSDINRRLRPQIKRLQTIDQDGLVKVRTLLDGSQAFVKEALVGHRRDTRQLELEIIKSIQREDLKPTEAEQQRKENIPTNLITLLDAYGIIETPEMRRLFEFLDTTLLRPNLSDVAYRQALMDLGEYLEGNQ